MHQDKLGCELWIYNGVGTFVFFLLESLIFVLVEWTTVLLLFYLMQCLTSDYLSLLYSFPSVQFSRGRNNNLSHKNFISIRVSLRIFLTIILPSVNYILFQRKSRIVIRKWLQRCIFLSKE